MALIGMVLERPVCAYCGEELKIGDRCLILQDDDGAMFDAHYACHALAEAESDDDEPPHVH